MDTQSEQKAEKFVKVQVVRSKDDVAIISLARKTGTRRYVIPAKLVTSKGVKESDLELAITYGVPWADEIKPQATPQSIENALHAADIWTAEDALKNPQAVAGALRSAFAVDLAAVLRAAHKYFKTKEVNK